MQALLNGSQFRKLLEKEYAQLQIDYNLRKIDIQILQYLSHAGNNDTAKDIVALGVFTKGHVSQSLAHLRAQGLVRALHDETDARCVHLQLEDAALDLIKRIETIYEHILSVAFQEVAPEELEVFKRVAKQIVKNIKTYVQ